MVQSINPNRLVPVTEDLVNPVDTFEVTRGLTTMIRRDFELAESVTGMPGEWLVLGNNGKLTRPTTTPVLNCYPVFSGTDRYDVATNNAATVIMSTDVVIRTKMYNTAGTYNVGGLLCVKDLGGGEAVVTPAANNEPHVAMVTAVGTDYIEYQILRGRPDTTA